MVPYSDSMLHFHPYRSSCGLIWLRKCIYSFSLLRSKRTFSKSIFGYGELERGCCAVSARFCPLMENTGRMPGSFVAYIIFKIFLFPSAFAQKFATLVVTRLFGGGASSVSINIVGGSISDVWRGDKARSPPMSLFGFSSVAGITLGPFVGSANV
ncbi:uncharacterized protein K441DRAFT_208736 [Cenococcum geophilum 1.58]|uniref:uncharacterized protein n=1 Tax=Cenococcum geophilum 1.58 TaxID=794803 RepID=UPI00358E35B6|nr:hypothetical protein K441DRAFT_208736 [Cenococcum geophilum 1.58]